MSEELTNYEAGIVQQYPIVERHVDELRDHVVRTTREAAALGSMLDEAQKMRREKFWAWLAELPIETRDDVIAIAVRAHRYQQKHPELSDPAQLSFTLGVPVERGEDGAAPKHESITVFQRVQNLMALVVKLRVSEPVARWSPLTRQKWKDALRPLIEVYREIGGE